MPDARPRAVERARARLSRHGAAGGRPAGSTHGPSQVETIGDALMGQAGRRSLLILTLFVITAAVIAAPRPPAGPDVLSVTTEAEWRSACRGSHCVALLDCS